MIEEAGARVFVEPEAALILEGRKQNMKQGQESRRRGSQKSFSLEHPSFSRPVGAREQAPEMRSKKSLILRAHSLASGRLPGRSSGSGVEARSIQT